ncbi:MAG: TonB-dependent receptor [Kofleriaceae bacterium]
MVRSACALVLLCGTAIAAPHQVTGRVIDHTTGAPIEGATVMAEHSSYATGTDGEYTVTVDDGENLVVTAPGYGFRIVAPMDEIELFVSSAEQINVYGKAPEAPRPPARYVLSSDDIRILPGSGNDMLRAAQVLPGVARLPYSYGGLVLRGSSPRDNAVYLDGIEVPLAFHFGGLTSFYPSGMLTDLTVENGGFEASYGRAQGGIVTLSTREPRRDKWREGGSVGLLDSSVFAEGPVGDGGIIMGVRRSYFDAVAIAWADDSIPLPSYLDAQVRMSFGDPQNNGRITPILFMAYDHVSAKTEKATHEDTTTLDMFFVRAGIPYLRQWGPLSLRVTPWIGMNELPFSSVTNGNLETFSRGQFPGGVRTDLTRDYTWGTLRGGLDIDAGYVSHTQEGLGQPGDIIQQVNGDTSLWYENTALWGEARFDALDEDRFQFRPGLRIERYGMTGENVIDPRLAIRERLTEHLVLREAVGRYHQPPTPGDLDPNGGNPNLKSSYFDQSAVGVDGEWNEWSGSLTAYYNLGFDLGVRQLDSTGEFKDLGGLGPTFELLLEKQLGLAFYRENLGRARDRGLELLVKHTTKDWLWMLSYTLSKAERDEPELVATPLDPMPDRGYHPFELDQRHNLNLVVSRKFVHWRFGARIQLVSGLPYTPLATPTNPNPALYSETLPLFFQLDLRADRTWQRSWGLINFYADIQNATWYPNVEAREIVNVDQSHPNGYSDLPGLPIAPFIGVEFVPK